MALAKVYVFTFLTCISVLSPVQQQMWRREWTCTKSNETFETSWERERN